MVQRALNWRAGRPGWWTVPLECSATARCTQKHYYKCKCNLCWGRANEWEEVHKDSMTRPETGLQVATVNAKSSCDAAAEIMNGRLLVRLHGDERENRGTGNNCFKCMPPPIHANIEYSVQPATTKMRCQLRSPKRKLQIFTMRILLLSRTYYCTSINTNIASLA